jgi:carbonic anhydrase
MRQTGLLGAILAALAATALVPAPAGASDAPGTNSHATDSRAAPSKPTALTPASRKASPPAKPAARVPPPLAPVRTETPQMAAPAAKQHAGTAPPAVSAGHAAHWAYEGPGGPEHWGNLKDEYRACGAGRQQSPIDIDNAGASRMLPISFHYKVSVIELVNNGHTVQANYGKGSYITVGDERFDLLQFHFHTPSEHRVAGRSFPMEIHFVHRNAQGRLAVVGVLIAPGEESLAAREIWDRLPAAPHSKSSDAHALINARDLMPTESRYFRYAGSLTTPPCSEQVDWYVLQQPMTFSIEQIGRIRGIMGGNARPVQARNGRYLLQGIDG